MKKSIVIILIASYIAVPAWSQITSEWRGPGRTGVYPDKGLLKEWPKGGPRLVMSATGLPKGNSSVAVGNGALYVAGTRDSTEVLVSLDMEGNVLWETPYGRAWAESYPESRSTPTLENERIYVVSGRLDAACIDAKSGRVIWSRQVADQYRSQFGRWGTSCSPLIVDNKCVITTGGNLTTVVALEKSTGEKVWTTESLNDPLGYVSPCLIDHHGNKQIIALTEKHILGVSPDNGRIIWKFDFSVYAGPEGQKNNTTTPLYSDGRIYVTSGYNHKSIMLALDNEGNSVSLVWADSVLDNHLGGVVHVGDYIFGSNWHNNSKGNWVCLDWNTGKVMYDNEWGNKGAIIAAEGMLYCYEEKKGNVGLINPTPDKFDMVSSFQVNLGSGPHWAHPVIHDKVLYIRHGDALLAYDIGAD